MLLVAALATPVALLGLLMAMAGLQDRLLAEPRPALTLVEAGPSVEPATSGLLDVVLAAEPALGAGLAAAV
jgi:hypothetical protein